MEESGARPMGLAAPCVTEEGITHINKSCLVLSLYLFGWQEVKNGAVNEQRSPFPKMEQPTPSCWCYILAMLCEPVW